MHHKMAVAKTLSCQLQELNSLLRRTVHKNYYFGSSLEEGKLNLVYIFVKQALLCSGICDLTATTNARKA